MPIVWLYHHLQRNVTRLRYRLNHYDFKGQLEPRALWTKNIILSGLNDDLFTWMQTFIQVAIWICRRQDEWIMKNAFFSFIID